MANNIINVLLDVKYVVTPRCQICYEEGHYATNYKNRYTKHDAHIAEALTNCTISIDTVDWYTDIGALRCMTSDVS